jgi:putative ABC transport system permease protein
MFKNYLKTALRFLSQNKLFAFINALGLTIALAVSFIILFFVINELSYDHCHKNRDKVFRVVNSYADTKNTVSETPFPLASALREDFPQIKQAIKIIPLSLTFKLNNGTISSTATATDSGVFDIFTLPLISNTKGQNLLEDKSSLVLSHDLAEKIFPGQNAVGKTITGIINDEENLFTVTGVFENIPENSSFRAECFVSSKWSVDYINKKFKTTNAEVAWDKDLCVTWLLLSDNSAAKPLGEQFRAFESKHMNDRAGSHYSLQNLSEVYLGSEKIGNTGIKGDLVKVEIFSAIALLILIVAAINYVILSTAVSSGRTREIAMRKTFGASITKIKNQLLGESVLLTCLILPVAFLFTWITLPFAGKLFQTQLNIIPSNIIIYVLVFLGLTIFIGFVSGIYTSSFLSGMRVLDIIKNSTLSGKRKSFFRSAMIVIQLVIFCSFVSATLIIHSQYKFVINKDLGYNNNSILLIDLGKDFKEYSAYLNTIRGNPDVIMAAGTREGLPMINSMSMMFPDFQDKNKMVNVEIMGVDYDFMKVMGISLVQGRYFSPEFGSDAAQSIIVNETAAKSLGLTDPIGKVLATQTIIGVVKDFNLHSLYSGIPPLAIILNERNGRQAVVHYKAGTLGKLLPEMEAEWTKLATGKPFHYTTIEEVIKNLYSSEKNLTDIISIFSLLTLLISAFGLFGLTLFIARSRTKEIGIRKVYGSPERSIIYSFLLENIILVSIAGLLSIPVTLHFMIKWLSKFPYKVEIHWWVFVVAYVIAAAVVILTVFVHSYRASRINPVNALRHE